MSRPAVCAGNARVGSDILHARGQHEFMNDQTCAIYVPSMCLVFTYISGPNQGPDQNALCICTILPFFAAWLGGIMNKKACLAA